MSSLHIRQVGYGLLLVVLCLVYAVPVTGAAPKEYDAEGTYLMNKPESQEIAEQRAFWKAKKEVLPKVKKDIEEFLGNKGISGSPEEIIALANLAMEIDATETMVIQRDNGTEIKVKVKVTVPENSIEKAFTIAEDTFRETLIVGSFSTISKDMESNEKAVQKAMRELGEAERQQEVSQAADKIQLLEQQLAALSYFEQGIIHSFYQRHQQAVEAFAQSIARNAKYAEAYSELGLEYVTIGRQQEAMTQFEKAASLDVKQLKPLLGKGLIALGNEQYEQSVEQFTHLLKINNQVAVAYYYRALCYAELEKHDLALSDLAKTIELDPWYAKAYRLRADIYNAKGLYEDAIKNYDIALHLNSAWFELYYAKAVACEKVGKVRDAVEAYRSFIGNAPESYAFLKVSARNKIRQMEQ